jgi:branched-chain amino acid transport system ATP-binding protein
MKTLSAQGVNVQFGGVMALNDVSLDVREGSIVGLIGPNGAGKTTLFNCISGFQNYSGAITYNNTDLHKCRSHQIVGLGIARTFQNINLFKEQTTLDNILIGAHKRLENPFAAMLSLPGALKRERHLRHRALELSDLLGLRAELDLPVKSLPYGIQKRVEMARALASDPYLIMLDEPVAGCNEEETNDLVRIIEYINQKLNITILLVEHDMSMVMKVCQYIYVLNFGQNLYGGTPEEVQCDPAVIAAYLGEDDAETQ